MSRNRFARAGMVVAALGLVAIASHASGSPFFRLEVGPAVAAGTQTKYKKAEFAVRPLVCDNPAQVQISGTAEGLVDGVRRSTPLTLVPVGTDGVHVVPRAWPAEGQWIVVLTATCPSSKATASTIVPFGKSGFLRDKVRVLIEPATRDQIEAALADVVRTQS